MMSIMSAPETTPVEDLEALVALLAAAGLSAAKEKAEVEDSDDEDSDDDEMSDDDGSDDDDSDDDDADSDDDEDDEADEEESEEDLEEAEVVELSAEPVETPVEVAAAPAAPVTDVVSPDHAQHLRLLEALVFAGTQALDEKELADRLPNDADVARLLADLSEMYANRGVNLVKVAGGYAFRTAPDLSEKLKIERPVTRKLSRAAIETLAIIAYHQPVTRAEIEQVRGVGLSKGTLDL